MRFLKLVVSAFLFCASVFSQSGAVVGSPIRADLAISSAPGLTTAVLSGGACRDNNANFWTTALVGSDIVLVRISPAGQVSGVVLTAVKSVCWDLAYDALRDRIWVVGRVSTPGGIGDGFEVIDASSGNSLHIHNSSLLGSPSPSGGMAWDGGDYVLIANTVGRFHAGTFIYQSGPLSVPFSSGGLLFHPVTGHPWVIGVTNTDPAGITETEYREHGYYGSQLSTIAPDVQIANGSFRGGRCIGIEGWLDPVNNEWLAVVSQRAGSAVVLSTIKLGFSQGLSCGPRFSKGPSVVQSQLYANASQVSGISWLVVSFAPGALVDPLFSGGCSLLLDPLLAVSFGPFFGNGSVACLASIPTLPGLNGTPLWYQWANFSLSGQVLLSETRSSVVRQF